MSSLRSRFPGSAYRISRIAMLGSEITSTSWRSGDRVTSPVTIGYARRDAPSDA